MSNINLVIFLIKFAVVVVTFSFAIYRVTAFGAQLPMPRSTVSGTSRATGRFHKGAKRFSTRASAKKEYTPSQIVIDDETGKKWRLCAGVAVLNSKHQLLVGERRRGKRGSWQCPQGGVDDAWTPRDSGTHRAKETIVEAATREMHEEIGLELGRHVMLEPNFPLPSLEASSNTGIRYLTAGTTNWLTRAGFEGQELHWTIFRCMDARGDHDPNEMCNLSGLGGESAEFTQVQWRDVQDVVEGVWEGKRDAYRALQAILKEHAGKWHTDRIATLDFAGKWSRNRELSDNIVAGLQARGLTKEDDAEEEAAKPYIQLWERDLTDASSWHVTTYNDDGTTPRRKLEYKPGTWNEVYQGKSTMFGESNEPVTLRRRTTYVGEIDADPIPVAQVTVTDGPKGVEESRRYRKGDYLYLRRTLWPIGGNNVSVVSTEVFTR